MNPPNPARSLTIKLIPALLMVVSPCVASEQAVFRFLQKHCLECHDKTEASGDLDMQCAAIGRIIDLRLQSRELGARRVEAADR